MDRVVAEVEGQLRALEQPEQPKEPALEAIEVELFKGS